jgi:hypothetical protein
MATTYGMTTPIMSSVISNPMTTINTVSSMGVQGLPMSSALPIIVNESTPNLAEIQSFPVVVRNGGIHIHQDPVTGQRYRMTDEFHSRIPQILAGNSSTIGMTGGVMPVASVETSTITNNRIGSTNNSLNSGVLIVGSNLSASQLEEAPQEPTVEINGVEFKQSPKKTSFKDETGKTYNVEIYNVFPESTLRGTTSIDSVLYSGRNVTTFSNQLNERLADSINRISTLTSKPTRYAYPSPTFVRGVERQNTVSVNFVNRYTYPSVK